MPDHASKPMHDQTVQTKILNEETWPALEELFGKRGAVGGCWCMYWRLPRKEFNQGSGDGNHLAFHDLVLSGKPAGILAYAGDAVAGWAAVAPRQDYPTLDRSRILKPVDDQPVWSMPCFFVARTYRHKGVLQALISAGEEYARKNGATILEAYPVDAGDRKMVDTFVYTGLASAFQKAGFIEVARRSETRPIMRKYLVA